MRFFGNLEHDAVVLEIKILYQTLAWQQAASSG